MFPNEIIIKIYEFSNNKINMIEVFPWLKNIQYKCSLCNNDAYYLIQFEYDNLCNNCGIDIQTDEYEFYCSLECKNLYFMLCSKEKNNIATYYCDKAECDSCGKRIMIEIKGNYLKLKNIIDPFRQQIKNFIDNQLIKDDDSKIEISVLIHNFKIYYNIHNTGKTKNEIKKVHNKISSYIKKYIKSYKNYYIGYNL